MLLPFSNPSGIILTLPDKTSTQDPVEIKGRRKNQLPMLSLLLLGATTTTALGASKLQARADDCTTFPSWTVQDFRSNATDTVGSGGVASFTIINNLSGAVDELRCDLQVNYRCIITGTPSDANLTVHVAVRSQSLILGLDKVVAGCPGRTTYVPPSFTYIHFVRSGFVVED